MGRAPSHLHEPAQAKLWEKERLWGWKYGVWILFWAQVAGCSVPQQDRGLTYMLPNHSVQQGVHVSGSPGGGL